MIKKLNVSEVYRKAQIVPEFKSTLELEELGDVILKQEKAKDAMNLGLSIDKYGYNIFISGIESSRKKHYLQSVLDKYAKDKKVPDDLCYVNNFKVENKPIFMRFASGDGHKFKKDMEDISEAIKKDLTTMLSSTSHKKELELIEQKYESDFYTLLKEYKDKVFKYGFDITESANGELVVIPVSLNRKPLSNRKYLKLINADEEGFRKAKNEVTLLLTEMYFKDSQLQDSKDDEIENFDKEKVMEYLDEKFEAILEEYKTKNNKIESYILGVKEYILDNLDIFKDSKETQTLEEQALQAMVVDKEDVKFKEFENKLSVNLLVDNKDLECAPVIFSKDIDEYNLFGYITNEINKKNLMTESSFMNIKAGDILKANGGYLVLDIEDMLMYKTDIWTDFKKILKKQEMKFTSKYSSNIVLDDAIDSEPIEIDIKVILVGRPEIYYTLLENDSEFKELFKIHSKFEYYMDRTPENELEYAKFIAGFCRENNLKPLTYKAVCKVIEYSSRISDSQDKLALYYSEIYSILIEADAFASVDKVNTISELYIEKAIDNQIERVNTYSKFLDEQAKNNEIILSVSGEKVGEVNALAVIDSCEYSLGCVSKITANTYKNESYELVSVDMDSNMSGNLHDKAVGNIRGFLGETFAKDEAIDVAINISFEQLYNGVDGDSATLAKTCAILSNLSGIPIKQSLSITGSMNQKGEAQIIGGANEKTEGFYDLCKSKECLNNVGVIMPKANARKLMLKKEVVDSIEKGEFTIFAIDSIEDAVKLLMGVEFKELKEIILENVSSSYKFKNNIKKEKNL